MLLALLILSAAFLTHPVIAVGNDAPTLDATRNIQDIITGKKYRFEIWNNLMILKRGSRSVDTFETGSIDHYPPDVQSFHNKFVSYQAVSRGSNTSGETYIFCILKGRITLSAVYCSYTGYCEYYETRCDIRRISMPDHDRFNYILRIAEHVNPGGVCPEVPQQKVHAYRRTTTLRFDTTACIFYSDSISLDKIHGESRIFSGKFPAIVLRNSTTFHSNCWRWLQSDKYTTHYLREPRAKHTKVNSCEG